MFPHATFVSVYTSFIKQLGGRKYINVDITKDIFGNLRDVKSNEEKTDIIAGMKFNSVQFNADREILLQPGKPIKIDMAKKTFGFSGNFNVHSSDCIDSSKPFATMTISYPNCNQTTKHDLNIESFRYFGIYHGLFDIASVEIEAHHVARLQGIAVIRDDNGVERKPYPGSPFYLTDQKGELSTDGVNTTLGGSKSSGSAAASASVSHSTDTRINQLENQVAKLIQQVLALTKQLEEVNKCIAKGKQPVSMESDA